MNLFGRKANTFINRALSSFFRRSSTNLNQYASREMSKAAEMINSRDYGNASEVIKGVLKELRDFKGTSDYNRILYLQARCYNYMRRFKDAEQTYLNILEYMKFNSTEYTPEDFLDAKLDIIHQYLVSNVPKGINFLEEVHKQHYESASTENQALLQYYKGLLQAADPEAPNNKEHLPKVKKHFLDLLNTFREVPELCVYSAHNIGVINWWMLQQSEQGEKELYKEAVEVLKESNEAGITQYLQNNLFKFERASLEPQDLEGLFKCMLFSFTLVSSTSMFVDVATMPKILSREFTIDSGNLLSLLTMSEIMLQTKPLRETGRKLLDIADNVARENSINALSKSMILRAAYHIDNKRFQEGIQILENLIREDIPPWEDYHKLMAYKFLYFSHKAVKSDPINLQKIQKTTKVLEEKLCPWSGKLASLYVPIAKHVMKENS